MDNENTSLVKLTWFDRIFKPQIITLPNGHSAMRRRSRTPLILILLAVAIYLSLQMTGFQLSVIFAKFDKLLDLFVTHWTEPWEVGKNGFAMLTEERRHNGIFADLSIAFNTTIANLDPYIRGGLLRDGLMKAKVDKTISDLRIKTPGGKEKIGNLSGGNQQKVILGRWLLTNPEVLLLDEPTRGIDVGAKYEIYQLINQLAAEGKCVIMVSSEMPELLGVCDRILVMSNGRQAGIFEAADATQVAIMEASAKYISAGGIGV